MPKEIYLDYASTTPTDPEVVKTMEPYWNKWFGNPSSIYKIALKSKQAIDKSRQTVANTLNCQPDEIIFTGGGTESINLAIKGIVLMQKQPVHMITSLIEHHAVLNACQRMQSLDHKLSLLPVDAKGLISLENLKKAIKPDTVLVTLMMANNEVGTIQPIQEFGNYIDKLNKERVKQNLPRIYFHTDACQATGALDLDVKKLHVDLLTINGSKIYGPKGMGALYLKKGTPIVPLIDGGGQERKLRSGTENVPGIVGFAKALELVNKHKAKENKRLSALRDWLIKEILEKIPKTMLNGHAAKRLPNNINISLLDVEGEAILLHLDEIGVQASTGSACTSDSLEPSHVIRALGCPHEVAHGSIRFTLGKYTTKQDLEYLMTKLPDIITNLRKTSPVKVNMEEINKAISNAERKILEL